MWYTKFANTFAGITSYGLVPTRVSINSRHALLLWRRMPGRDNVASITNCTRGQISIRRPTFVNSRSGLMLGKPWSRMHFFCRNNETSRSGALRGDYMCAPIKNGILARRSLSPCAVFPIQRYKMYIFANDITLKPNQ